jgi:GNAT superfamily N-acetyltransferase
VLAVSLATPSDTATIAELMEELDRFYGATEVDPASQRLSEIEAALFASPPAAYVLLARDDDQVVGLASYSFLWPATGLTRSLYLKELYVRQPQQRHGVGAALMRAICAIAKETQCSRVEWTTENTNATAMQFYAKLKAPINAVKVSYRFDTEDINRILGDEA